MKNGLIILLLLGVGFIFFATNFMKEVEEDPDRSSYTYTPKKETIYNYFIESPSGEKVFDPANLPLSKAKELWNSSNLKSELMDLYPKFDLMKKYAKLHIATGEFLDLILSKISEAQNRYQAGEANYEEARRIVENL